MPRWTDEQQLAINMDGTNIIVSAGAGSGKTAVLSERVIRKIKDGIDIDKLLILTFTKAAAFEMMIRIRGKIKDNIKTSSNGDEKNKFIRQLAKIESSYITTFDSFSLSLVKKYHYILNINKNIKIVNQAIIDIELNKIIDNIFDELYKESNSSFLKLIDNYTLKDDQTIKNLIISMFKKLDLMYDKDTYLNNYVANNYNDSAIDKLINEYEAFILSKVSSIKLSLKSIEEEIDSDYYESISLSLFDLINSKNYTDVVNNLDIKLPNLPKNSSDYLKNEKENISNTIKEIKALCIYDNLDSIREYLLSTVDSIEIIIDILIKLDKRIDEYKRKNDSYEFIDISKLAIKLVRENPEIREEIKDPFNEIMIDEYQDTSDLQEEFISLISNDNVYMVGDIKQSIYRFRNANPYIFKDKYDRYSKKNGGIKIDLIKNFRSREEVIDNINLIFNYIMDDLIGGCNYQSGHQMVFGQKNYEENKNLNNNYNFDILNYNINKDCKFTSDEIEAFIILRDIENKIKNNYQVIDKETFKLRNVNYEDFAILIDRASKFELYKRIFEYYNVPLTVYKDTSITSEDDIFLISNILNFIYLIKNKISDEEFKYMFISIARSYLFSMDDNTIFKIINDNDYFNTDIYKIASSIANVYDDVNISKLLELIIDKFDFYNKKVLVGNVDDAMARIDYIEDLFKEYIELGYSNDEVISEFKNLINKKYDIKVGFSNESDNGVKIMTIHKSKGLEFPILYLSGLNNKFNISDLNEKFIFDNNYGFIIPFYDDREIVNIKKPLLKNRYLIEEIGEKIRLFYVALTRAKEKIILITNVDSDIEKERVNNVVLDNYRSKYISFLDILKSIWGNLNNYITLVDLEKLNMTRDYRYVRDFNIDSIIISDDRKLEYRDLNISKEIIDKVSFSKKINKLIDRDMQEKLNLGIRLHYILETIDFKEPDYTNLTAFEKDKIEKFLNLDIIKNNINSKFYKEYEFVYEENNDKKNGIIDLMIDNDEEIIIIDYKLKYIGDEEYVKQLNGYRQYISSKSDKKVFIYLYSIIDGDLKELKKMSSII